MKKLSLLLFLLIPFFSFSQNNLKDLVGNWSGKGKMLDKDINLSLSTTSMSNFQFLEIKIDEDPISARLSGSALLSFDTETNTYVVNWTEKIMGVSSEAFGKVELLGETINLVFNDDYRNFVCKFVFNSRENNWAFSYNQFSNNKKTVLIDAIFEKKK